MHVGLRGLMSLKSYFSCVVLCVQMAKTRRKGVKEEGRKGGRQEEGQEEGREGGTCESNKNQIIQAFNLSTVQYICPHS